MNYFKETTGGKIALSMILKRRESLLIGSGRKMGKDMLQIALNVGYNNIQNLRCEKEIVKCTKIPRKNGSC